MGEPNAGSRQLVSRQRSLRRHDRRRADRRRRSGIALSYAIHWFPVPASTQANEHGHALPRARDRLDPDLRAGRHGDPVLRLAVPHAPGEELKDGPPIHGNTRLEVVLDGDPGALAAGARRLLVRGAARQRKEAGGGPAGDPDRSDRSAVRLDLRIPTLGHRRRAPEQLRSSTCPTTSRSTSTCAPRTSSTPSGSRRSACRRTSVPGITTHYRATPDRLGTYPVVCNLLCGVGHSLMRSTVHVVTPASLPDLDQEPGGQAAGARLANGPGAELRVRQVRVS